MDDRFLSRAAAALAVLTAVLVVAPPADAKKKQKPRTPDATFSGKLSVTKSGERSNGTESQKLTVTMTDGEANFLGATGSTARGKAKVAIEYEATFVTDDRSWHAGCDHEERTSKASWKGTVPVVVGPVTRRSVKGRDQKYLGWSVEFGWRDVRLKAVTTGSYQDWESIAMENCLTFPITEPLGGWSPYFLLSVPMKGRIADDNRSVPLTTTETASDETASVEGKLKFATSVTGRR